MNHTIKMKLVAAGLLICLPFLGTIHVSGAGTDYPIAAGSLHVTKVLKSNLNTELNTTFRFAAVPVTEDAPVSVITPITVSKPVNQTDASGTGAISFAEFPHAGVYDYTLSETADCTGLGKGFMRYDTAAYLMKVLVVNTDTGLAVREIHVANTGTGNKVSEENIIFTNYFSRAGGEGIANGHGLTLTNNVTGDYGDKTKKFNYQLRFNVPGNGMMPDGTDYDPLRIAASGPNGESITPDNSGVFSFSLADGEKITFDNLTAGVQFIVKAMPEPGYSISMEYMFEGNQKNTPSAGTNTMMMASGCFITTGENNGTFTSAAEAVEVTGVSLDSAPFIFMTLLAVTVIVISFRIRREKQSG
ncbi:MAG: hypothetical protein EOM64_07650 [Erysipelotrichia bacterium]|nr:hypothetical protein [Erysipelotrichia bacterium]